MCPLGIYFLTALTRNFNLKGNPESADVDKKVCELLGFVNNTPPYKTWWGSCENMVFYNFNQSDCDGRFTSMVYNVKTLVVGDVPPAYADAVLLRMPMQLLTSTPTFSSPFKTIEKPIA
jgi:hypothetical protein